MHDEHPARLLFKAGQPADQPLLIRVSAHSLKGHDGGSHVHRLSEQLHFLCALQDLPPQRADGLIAHEQDRAFRPPEVVLQMMPDPPGLAHARRRNDHLRRLVKIDGLRLVAGDGKLQSGEGKRIDPLAHQFHRLVVKALIFISFKNFRGLHRQRAVHVDREIPVARHHVFFLDLP